MADVLQIGDDAALKQSHINFQDPSIIYFHAFLESSQATAAWIIKTAYLQRKQHNIILVNAPRLEAGPWYVTASRNTQVVGEYTAMFIDYLVSNGLDLKTLHLLGLSLGAQMAGVAGSSLKSGKVARITGMDPAGPLFTKLPNSLKLDKSDAEFVDIIHTDAGIFGYPTSIGHVDFWPNQGISPQPGCLLADIKKRNPDTIIELGIKNPHLVRVIAVSSGASLFSSKTFHWNSVFCSHWRSYQFYAESVINEASFISTSCNNWNEYLLDNCNPHKEPIYMGYATPITASGNYYLTTNPESPFSLQANVTYE